MKRTGARANGPLAPWRRRDQRREVRVLVGEAPRVEHGVVRARVHDPGVVATPGQPRGPSVGYVATARPHADALEEAGGDRQAKGGRLGPLAPPLSSQQPRHDLRAARHVGEVAQRDPAVVRALQLRRVRLDGVVVRLDQAWGDNATPAQSGGPTVGNFQ